MRVIYGLFRVVFLAFCEDCKLEIGMWTILLTSCTPDSTGSIAVRRRFRTADLFPAWVFSRVPLVVEFDLGLSLLGIDVDQRLGAFREW